MVSVTEAPTLNAIVYSRAHSDPRSTLNSMVTMDHAEEHQAAQLLIVVARQGNGPTEGDDNFAAEDAHDSGYAKTAVDCADFWGRV